MTPDEAHREIERREEMLRYDAQRIAELEAQCATMREALEKVSWGSLPIIRAQGCRQCLSIAIGRHADGCIVGAALAPDAGRALLERLERAEIRALKDGGM